MIRYKVIKGSHLLLWFAVIVLLAAILFVALQGDAKVNMQADDTRQYVETINAVSMQEAKAPSAFASNSADKNRLSIEVIADAPPEASEAPDTSILIYHTHTHEAYAQNAQDPYVAIEAWRTLDAQHSVVRVGEALADALRELGYSVTHDTSDHEQDSLDDAYIRSLETLEGYRADGAEFDLTIDLHRDAYVDGLLPFCKHNENEYAQIMLLVGRGDAYEADKKPAYEANLAFAQRITSFLNSEIPGICRNVTVKQGRYNQHMGKLCILAEVGHNQNSLEQALESVPHLAKAINYALKIQI